MGVSFTHILRELRKDESNNTSLYLSAEYSSRGDYYYVPVLANIRLSTPTNLYYLAGAGVGFGKRPDSAGSTETVTQIAWQAGIGYDFTIGSLPSLFEIRYVSGQRATWNTIGFYYGVRF